MKKNQIVNWVSFALAGLNVVFVLAECQWHLVGFFIILLAFISLIVATIFAFQTNKQNGLGNIANYAITIILLLLILDPVFYILHWPHSHELRQGMFFILPVIILLANKQHKVSNSYWMTFLIYTMIIYINMSFNFQRLSNELGDCERKQEQVQVSNGQQ